MGRVHGLSMMSASGDVDRLEAKRTHAPGVNGGQGIAQRRRENCEFRPRIVCGAKQHVRADEPGDARHSGECSEQFEPAQFLFRGEHMRGQDGEERRRRVED
jgi:hypothetical protein